MKSLNHMERGVIRGLLEREWGVVDANLLRATARMREGPMQMQRRKRLAARLTTIERALAKFAA